MLEGQEFDGSECTQEETMPSEPVKCHLVTHKDGCRHLIPNLSPMTISGYEAIGSSVVAHMAIPATDYAALLAEHERRGADCIALLSRAETAERERDEAVRALTEIARGVLDDENGGDYIDKVYRLARTTLSRLPAATSHAETMRKVRAVLDDIVEHGDTMATELAKAAISLLGKDE